MLFLKYVRFYIGICINISAFMSVRPCGIRCVCLMIHITFRILLESTQVCCIDPIWEVLCKSVNSLKYYAQHVFCPFKRGWIFAKSLLDYYKCVDWWISWQILTPVIKNKICTKQNLSVYLPLFLCFLVFGSGCLS